MILPYMLSALLLVSTVSCDGPLPSFMTGKFNFDKSEGFSDFLSALGLNFVKRNIACTLSPIHIISQTGDVINIKTESKVHNTNIEFKLNTPFQELTADGRQVTTTPTLEGADTLVKVQVGEKQTVVESRSFPDGGSKMVLTHTIKEKPDIKSVRTYVRAA